MSLDLGSFVWDREEEGGANTMSRRAYTASVSGFTMYGVILASIAAYLTLGWRPQSIASFLIIGLAIPTIGIIIAAKSEQWPISLIGYTMVVIGMGMLLGPTVAMFKTGVVIVALGATAGVTILMSLIGILYPKSLEHWGAYLFGCLVALLFVRFGQVFMASMGVSESIWYLPWIEYAGAVLFCIYIIYDWNRALRLPHTMDNAVDCAMAIFLDIINLFLMILRALGSRSSTSSD